MGPKKHQQQQKKGPAPGEEVEETLQAVVLADSFETRFTPFTLERPRCLLPLANIPLIEYTFEFLANAGVADIFVYCGAHTDQVEEYIRNSKWTHSSSPFTRLDIIRSTSHSVGDAMRDLDHRDIITGDFLIVSGDVVSNLPLEEAIAKHRARRAADKNAIMTMILREAGGAHRTKAQGVTPVFVVDPTKDRCLHYEEMRRGQEDRYLHIEPELMSGHSELEVRQDLIDCHIDICTPDVLALWTDSFDYESPRKHFLHGVLKDYELNGKTIHTHIIDDHYAARVQDLHAYDAVSKDIVSRWAYPLCPDSNLLRGQSYRLQRGNIYKEDGVVLARSSVVKRSTILGQGSSIGDGSEVGKSIIGRRCQIGKNVIIEGSHIWDDAVVGDGTVVRHAVIANEAVVGKNCRVEPGALISYGVRIADGIKVSGISRITRCKRKRDADDALVSVPSEPEIVGPGGEGYDYEESDDEDIDEDERAMSSGLIYNMANLAVSDSSISTMTSEISEEPPQRMRSAASSFATTTSEDANEDEFHHDAASSIYDSLQRGDTSDVIQLEMMGLRMSNNASDHQMRRAMAAAFTKHIHNLVESGSANVSQAVPRVFKDHKDLITRTIFDRNQEEKVDQVDFLLLMQRDLIGKSKGDSILLFTAKELYDLEVIEEESFDQWWNDERSSADPEMRKIRSQTEQFVEWLANAEEDSSEEEDSEEDDE
ncbi:translation initiation factor eif-2b epsilon subunit [Xylona heveae TC161]|uniref:Mannose-1-phosphate guanyltransferase n=1 Tax=Xylona heveae (strain CBS 132557 / TC161) TaxID=1328760 RepID=A0A165G8A9_XYLHT|nr:translation initiation factor eif-2b epsilon subunit [Xylona heveae TC161]KZF21859.1 translation initiation factor eif-2b epsilon subunit [Xylona heveae TC161]